MLMSLDCEWSHFPDFDKTCQSCRTVCLTPSIYLNHRCPQSIPGKSDESKKKRALLRTMIGASLGSNNGRKQFSRSKKADTSHSENDGSANPTDSRSMTTDEPSSYESASVAVAFAIEKSTQPCGTLSQGDSAAETEPPLWYRNIDGYLSRPLTIYETQWTSQLGSIVEHPNATDFVDFESIARQG